MSERTGKLYGFARKAASAASFDDVVWVAVSHVGCVLGCRAMVLVPDDKERVAIVWSLNLLSTRPAAA